MNILHICVILCALEAAVAQSHLKIQCMEEAKATREELRNFFQNGLKEEDVTDAIKNHMKCIFIKSGSLKDGKIQGEAMIQFLAKEPEITNLMADITKAVNECNTEMGADDTETVYNFVICLQKYPTVQIFFKNLAKTF